MNRSSLAALLLGLALASSCGPTRGPSLEDPTPRDGGGADAGVYRLRNAGLVRVEDSQADRRIYPLHNPLISGDPLINKGEVPLLHTPPGPAAASGGWTSGPGGWTNGSTPGGQVDPPPLDPNVHPSLTSSEVATESVSSQDPGGASSSSTQDPPGVDPRRRADLMRLGLWRFAQAEGVDKIWDAYGTVYRAYSTGGKTPGQVRSWAQLVRAVLAGRFQGVDPPKIAKPPSKVAEPPTIDEVADEVDEAPPLWKATLATLAAQPAVWTWAAAARCRSAEGEAVHLEADPYTVAQIERHAAVIEAALGEGRRLVVETRRAAA